MQKWQYTYGSDVQGFHIYLASHDLRSEDLDLATLHLEKKPRHWETAETICAHLNQLLDFGIMDIGHNPKS